MPLTTVTNRAQMSVKTMRKPNNTETTLDFVSKRSASELRCLWGEAFGSPLSFRLQKELLIRFLAHRLQENAYGGMRAATAKGLNRLVEQFKSAGPVSTSADVPSFKPGTRLLREWQGQTFEVTVLDSGFAYRGTRYESLSRIAREITGARWSGPRFFGLKSALSNDTIKQTRHGR